MVSLVRSAPQGLSLRRGAFGGSLSFACLPWIVEAAASRVLASNKWGYLPEDVTMFPRETCPVARPRVQGLLVLDAVI